MFDTPSLFQPEESGSQIMLRIFKLALPSMIALTFSYLAELINTLYIGHLNDPSLLAGTGMGNIIIYMFF
jgi:Na+-driven multidrug efflux pump